MGEYDEQIVFEMGYNKGFKDGIKGSIPKAEIKKFLEEGTKDVGNNVLAIVREDYIHKADYENRLKADMVAMLEDLKQDFIAEAYGIEMNCTDYVVNVADIDKIIQQKINDLRGVEDGNS